MTNDETSSICLFTYSLTMFLLDMSSHHCTFLNPPSISIPCFYTFPILVSLLMFQVCLSHQLYLIMVSFTTEPVSRVREKKLLGTALSSSRTHYGRDLSLWLTNEDLSPWFSPSPLHTLRSYVTSSFWLWISSVITLVRKYSKSKSVSVSNHRHTLFVSILAYQCSFRALQWEESNF